MDDDILSFGHTRKISFKAALKDVQATRPKMTVLTESSSLSSDLSDEEERRPGRKRRHQVGGKEGSLASQLIHNKLEPCVLSSDSDDEDCGLAGKKKAKKRVPTPPVLSDSSGSPSPEPSPPRPGGAWADTPTDKKSKRVLNKANNALNQLMFSTYSTPGSEYNSDLNESLVSSASKQSITLRVRYRGKIRKYTVTKGDPLSLVCAQLAAELQEEDSSSFLLSHKTLTLSQTESLLTLGLTTADIIDAIKLSEASSSSTTSLDPSSIAENIKIKVQTSKKTKTYSISKTDPLQKVMDAFAKELDAEMDKLIFSFDGDPISAAQTAEQLDMEDGDCIDARFK